MANISKDIYSSIFNTLHSDQFASTVSKLQKADYMLFYDVTGEKMIFVKDKTEWSFDDDEERKFTQKSYVLERKSFAARKAIEQKYSLVWLGSFAYPDIDINWIAYCANLAAYIRLPEYKKTSVGFNDVKFD